MRLLVLALTVAVVAAWCGGSAGAPARGDAGKPPVAERVRVASVPNGETLRLADGRRILLRDIDAPTLSPRRCYGPSSREALTALSPPGSTIVLRGLETARRGRSKSHEAYVYASGRFVNREMVKRGAAAPLLERGKVGPIGKGLIASARAAQAKGRGLWTACEGTKLTPYGTLETGPPPVPGTALFRLGDSWRTATGYRRYAYLIVSRSGAREAARQEGTSLVYHSGIHVNRVWDAGVPYAVARERRWLLPDSSGSPMPNKNFPENYVADVGDPAYQAEWARRVGNYLEAVGADGVFIDDVIADVSTVTEGGVFPPKYPNQSAWESAMASFVGYVGPKLDERGFYVLASALKRVPDDERSNDGSLTAEWWGRLAPSVDGFVNEYFVQNPIDRSHLRRDGPAWYDNWAGWSGLAAVAQGRGRDFVGLTYGTQEDVRAMRYMRASHLLYWSGRGGAVSYHVDETDPWNREWTITIGMPTGSRYAVGVGWRRNYTGGTVLLNPSPSSPQTFPLGDRYVLPDGSAVTAVTLSATTGLVLRTPR